MTDQEILDYIDSKMLEKEKLAICTTNDVLTMEDWFERIQIKIERAISFDGFEIIICDPSTGMYKRMSS